MTTPTKTEANGKPQISSPHLSAARELLGDLEAVTTGPGSEHQVKATAAVAHAVLVLAEQVAAARVLMFADASKLANAGDGSK